MVNSKHYNSYLKLLIVDKACIYISTFVTGIPFLQDDVFYYEFNGGVIICGMIAWCLEKLRNGGDDKDLAKIQLFTEICTEIWKLRRHPIIPGPTS